MTDTELIAEQQAADRENFEKVRQLQEQKLAIAAKAYGTESVLYQRLKVPPAINVVRERGLVAHAAAQSMLPPLRPCSSARRWTRQSRSRWFRC